jgi:bifunctional non-homologous end joining protein LigD
LNGAELRKEPLEKRKAALEKTLRKADQTKLRFNDHIEGDGATIFRHACRLGAEGIAQSGGILATAPAGASRGSK